MENATAAAGKYSVLAANDCIEPGGADTIPLSWKLFHSEGY